MPPPPSSDDCDTPRLGALLETLEKPNPWTRLAILFASIVGLVVMLTLMGCTTGDYRRPLAEGGTMVGPYDLTLNSHREALGLRR